MISVFKDYRILAVEKQLERSKKIPKEWLMNSATLHDAIDLLKVPATCGILTEMECEITSNYDATALLEKLKSGVWSAEQVTTAFCKRAAIAQQMVNCLTEILFASAITRAQELDKHRLANPTTSLPPLWGLPISLKDSFAIVGHDTSTGLGCYVSSPAKENSALAAMLVDLGAVLYCKTNLPQSIMTGDSDNHIFGRTLNPRNVTLTAGGSTGGEGALIALRGSILGVGTDIGGSIRVPALCNGIYGMRTSVGLVPHGGVRDLNFPGMGMEGVRSSVGPMATSARDCVMFLKAVIQAGSWRYDNDVLSIPWVGVEVKKKLRVGIVEDDGVYTPTPPVRRGLMKTVKILKESERIELIPLKLPRVKEHYQHLLSYYTLLGSDYYYEQFEHTGEPLIPSLEKLGLFQAVRGTKHTLEQYFELNICRAEAAKEYLALFKDNDIDAILMPPAPNTALPLDTWSSITYTGLWNYLDYPAVVIPVDVVRECDVVDEVSNAKHGAGDEELYGLYTGPEDYKNAPIAVQIVGYKHQDEALANTVVLLDSIINYS